MHTAPRRTAPMQPRLDWRMWFAALGSYRECARATLLYLSIKNRSAATTLSSAVFDRYGTAPRSFGATFWNPGVKTEKTAKKRRKTEQKWARNGLKKVGPMTD